MTFGNGGRDQDQPASGKVSRPGRLAADRDLPWAIGKGNAHDD